MAETKIANVIVPEVFNDYFIENGIRKTNIWRSGIVTLNPKMYENLLGGASTFTTPFWKDFVNDTDEAEIPSETTDVKVDGINAGEFVVRRQFRVKAWGANALSAILSGDDPMGALMTKVESYWNNQFQGYLFATLRGIIASNITNNAGDMVIDLTAKTGTESLISYDSIISALFTQGDRFNEFTAIAMHSVPYQRLIKLNLIDTKPDNEQNIGWGTYFGKTIILDDYNTSVTEGDKVVYYSTLFKSGAFGYAEVSNNHEMTEIERDPKKGFGIDILHNRRCFALHPQGFDWKETSVTGGDVNHHMPNNTDLANGANWARSAGDVKMTGLAVIKTLG